MNDSDQLTVLRVEAALLGLCCEEIALEGTTYMVRAVIDTERYDFWGYTCEQAYERLLRHYRFGIKP